MSDEITIALIGGPCDGMVMRVPSNVSWNLAVRPDGTPSNPYPRRVLYVRERGDPTVYRFADRNAPPTTWVQTIEIDRTVAEWFVREHPDDFPALLAFVRQEAEASIESLARHIASLPAPSEP